MNDRIKLITSESETDPLWIVTYHISEDTYDDDMDATSTVEVELNAASFTMAFRYAQQYLKQKQHEDEQWVSAEILGIEQY